MTSRPVVLAIVLVSSCISGACNGTSEPTAPAPPVISSGNSQIPAGTPPPERAPAPVPPPPERPPAPVPPPGVPDRSNCDERKAAWAIGEPASADLLERARDAAGAKSARFLQLGQPITMEFQTGRLNLSHDTQNIIRKVTCG